MDNYNGSPKRAFDFQNTARRFGIPESKWNDPAIKQLVEFVNEAENFQYQLTTAAHGERHNDLSLNKVREIFNSPDMVMTLSRRYQCCELIMRAVIHILSEGIHGNPSDFKGYVRGKLNVAAGYLGLEVKIAD